MNGRLEKYLASMAAISAVCGHALLFSDSGNSSAQNSSTFQANDTFNAELLSMFADFESTSEPQSSEMFSTASDSTPGLLYFPEESQGIPALPNLKIPSVKPDDAAPGLLYMPSEPAVKVAAEDPKPIPALPSKASEAGLFYTPPVEKAPPSCDPERRGCISGGFLYWFAKQNGLDYTNQSQSTFTTGDFTSSSLEEPDFKWRPGFELDASYGFNRSYAALGLHFTYYQGKADGHKTAKDFDGIFPVLSFSEATVPSDFVTSADVNWTLTTALLDADLLYEIPCGRWFSLVPFLALRNAWIHQKVRAEYEGGTFTAGPDTIRLMSCYFGIGPLLGIMPKISLGRCCYLYGEASGAYLWGSFDVRQKEMFLSTMTAHLKREPSGNRWNGNFSAGLKFGKDWRKRFCGMKHLDVDIGADYLFFSKQDEFVHGAQFTLPKRDKTLKLYGIHISLAAYF